MMIDDNDFSVRLLLERDEIKSRPDQAKGRETSFIYLYVSWQGILDPNDYIAAELRLQRSSSILDDF
jgi:hypothetical protein